MKKLTLLFSLFALIFIGCQKTGEDITSPTGELQKDPIVLNWGNPEAGTSIYTVDLIAGQHDDVGDVTIEKYLGGLRITYLLDEGSDCEITEAHVDIAKGITGPPFSIDFHVNSQGSPTFGNFDSKTLGSVDFTDPQAVVVIFTEAELKLALGVTTVPSEIFLAIHGVVCCDGEESTEFVCPELAASSTLVSYVNNSVDYTFDFVFNPAVANGETNFSGWCVDLSKTFTGAAGSTFSFVCSYGGNVSTCVVDSVQNLAMANWVINNRAGYDWASVQMALWELLGPYQAGDYLNPYDYPIYANSNFAALVAAARAYEEANGPFVPGCGDKVLVIAYDGTDPCNRTYQGIAIEVDAECVQTCETAMAFNYPVDNTSSLFPGSQWFRYISLNY